jgi:hypothetical protein
MPTPLSEQLRRGGSSPPWSMSRTTDERRGVVPGGGRPVRRTAVPAPRLLNSWRAGKGARRCVVDFSERPPSKQWAALKYAGEKLAEVWFKPEGEPFALTFRIPRTSFQTPGAAARLTPENLLKAVGLATEEVESWRHGDLSRPGLSGSRLELGRPLPPPPQEVTHLSIYVSLKPPPHVVAPEGGDESEIASPQWQDLEARWNAILGLEAGIDTLRLTLEGMRVELENSWKKTLTPEEKLHALKADVAQWNKAKSRIHYVLPKVKDFVHRATWAMGTPERKELGALFEGHDGPDIPFRETGRVPGQLESLLKDRQVLSAHGTAVCAECKSIAEQVQGALRTLRSNSVANERRKRDVTRAGGKFFKEVRRWSMGGG